MIVAFTLLVGIAFLLSLLKPSKKYKLPEGPNGLPIIGNIHKILVDAHVQFAQWGKEYGGLYTLNLGPRKALVINDYKSMKEILSHPASTGKFKTDTFLLVSRGEFGIINTVGDVWAEQRQFAVRTLIKHGFGNKKSMEPIMAAEGQEICEWINETMEKEGSVSLINTLRIATNNTLATMITGQRFSLRDTEVINILEELLDAMQDTVKTGLFFLPWMKHIAPNWSGYLRLDNASKALSDFTKKHFEEHKKTFQLGIERDVIDSYLEKNLLETNPQSSFYGDFGKENCEASVGELFGAGGETTPHSLNWLLLYVAHHPNVQAKMHSEIDDVIGRLREPSLLDKAKMPYLEAVIMESLRKASFLPMGVLHEMTEDIEYQDFIFPKGLLLIPNIYRIHNDPHLWGDPEKFRPERFLDFSESEPKLVKREGCLPFQIGKRVCPGMILANEVMFFFVAKIFQTYHVVPVDSTPNFEPDVGLSLVAKPFRLIMKKRD